MKYQKPALASPECEAISNVQAQLYVFDLSQCEGMAEGLGSQQMIVDNGVTEVCESGEGEGGPGIGAQGTFRCAETGTDEYVMTFDNIVDTGAQGDCEKDDTIHEFYISLDPTPPSTCTLTEAYFEGPEGVEDICEPREEG